MGDLLAYIVAASLHRDFDRAYLPLPEKSIILAAADASWNNTLIGGFDRAYIRDQIILAAGEGRLAPWRRGVGGQTELDPDVPDPPAEDPSADAGAALPITYTIGDLGGTARYVSTSGSGSVCSLGAPCATISAAHTAASAGDPIIVRAGTYGNVGNTWSGSAWSSETFITKAGIKLYAYPGETVVFDGSSNIIAGPWTTEGSYKYATYVDRPCGNGFGIVYCTEGVNDNVNGTDSVAPFNVGKYMDAVWVDGVQLQQVVTKAEVAAGKFYVSPTNDRLYLPASVVDAAATEIAVCNRGDFITVLAADVVMSGFTVKRYCNSPAKAAVIDLSNGAADRFHMSHVVLEDFQAVVTLFMGGLSSDPLDDPLIEYVTITGAPGIGINPVHSDGAIFRKLRITGLDPWDEMASFPGAGAIKTSRIIHSIVEDSFIANNRSQAVWYDQSNWDAHIRGNTIINNGDPGEGTTVFFELSNECYIYNNTIRTVLGVALKFAGSSNCLVWNNTLIGGPDVVGVYADNRSMLNCATTGLVAGTGATCPGFPSSDRWTATWASAPADLNWLTRGITLGQNIIAYPTSTGFCGGLTGTCFSRINSSAILTLASMIPVGTEMDCNVYAVPGGDALRHTHPTLTTYVGYATPGAFATAMAGASPYPDIDGLEANSLSGVEYVNADGTPTAALTALHASSACAFPTDATMNATIAAGTKHYGVTYH